MLGSRPLSESEVNSLLDNLYNPRDKLLCILGIKTGFRISELLSITFEQCVQYGKVRDSITVSRANMKGKNQSRTVVLHPEAKAALEGYINTHMATATPEERLFPICRQSADRILRRAVKRARIEGKVSTHSFRKSFCKKVYEALGRDLVNTQRAMGHRSVQSTISYLSFDQEAINQAIKGI